MGRLDASLFFALLAFTPAWAQGHYDLGGPCQPNMGVGPIKEIQQAKQAGLQDQVIELEKANVRGGCGIAFRWSELAGALLDAHRDSEALAVLQEMDARGLDLNPAVIAPWHPNVAKFMETPAFRTSPVGVKIERLKTIADERRAQFRSALQQLAPDQKPPQDYVAEGVCPFECCRYGRWTVGQDTELVAAPGSNRVVGAARKGEHVEALTGEVHVHPEPVVVVKGGDLSINTVAFVLDRGGEGYAHVYTQGKIVDVFVGVAQYCLQSDWCWGEALEPAAAQTPQVWWVKIRLPDGITGWTDKPGHFGGNDACG